MSAGEIVILLVIFAVIFVAGALVMRKHATRIEAAAKSVKADAEKMQSHASAVQATVVKAATEIRAAIKQ